MFQQKTMNSLASPLLRRSDDGDMLRSWTMMEDDGAEDQLQTSSSSSLGMRLPTAADILMEAEAILHSTYHPNMAEEGQDDDVFIPDPTPMRPKSLSRRSRMEPNNIDTMKKTPASSSKFSSSTSSCWSPKDDTTWETLKAFRSSSTRTSNFPEEFLKIPSATTALNETNKTRQHPQENTSHDANGVADEYDAFPAVHPLLVNSKELTLLDQVDEILNMDPTTQGINGYDLDSGHVVPMAATSLSSRSWKTDVAATTDTSLDTKTTTNTATPKSTPTVTTSMGVELEELQLDFQDFDEDEDIPDRDGTPTNGASSSSASLSTKSTSRLSGSGACYKPEQWDKRYKELLQFKQVYGHCRVPHNWYQNRALAQWVKRQRYQYTLQCVGKHSTLTSERIQTLDDIGFIWKSHQSKWDKKFDELIEFKEQFGHCHVPNSYPTNHGLSVWVKCQRRHYKTLLLHHRKSSCSDEEGKKSISSPLTKERIQRLQSLGFSFTPPRGMVK